MMIISNLRKILEQNSSGFERNFDRFVLSLLPIENLPNILFGDVESITITNSSFKQVSDRDWELLCNKIINFYLVKMTNLTITTVVKGIQVIILVLFSIDGKFFQQGRENHFSFESETDKLTVT